MQKTPGETVMNNMSDKLPSSELLNEVTAAKNNGAFATGCGYDMMSIITGIFWTHPVF